MSDFTPGPWAVCRINDDYLIESRDGYAIGAAFDNNGWPINAENARLISAAPELLEALLSVLDVLGALGNRYNLNNYMHSNDADKVWAAINKARGEA